MDHWIELEAHDEIIALLKEKVQQLRGSREVAESRLGSGCSPNAPKRRSSQVEFILHYPHYQHFQGKRVGMIRKPLIVGCSD